MKKVFLLCVSVSLGVLTGCGTTQPPQDVPADALQEFDKEAKELILDLDREEIERLKGQGEQIQINAQ